ncbi:MAG: hypothetical protein ACK4J1_00070 [Hylemonella sp.]
MINASPRTEHASKGQIGQPAACMMENKGDPPSVCVSAMAARVCVDLARIITERSRGLIHRGGGSVHCIEKLTHFVDNFVCNLQDKGCGPAN